MHPRCEARNARYEARHMCCEGSTQKCWNNRPRMLKGLHRVKEKVVKSWVDPTAVCLLLYIFSLILANFEKQHRYVQKAINCKGCCRLRTAVCLLLYIFSLIFSNFEKKIIYIHKYINCKAC